jgi:hypothetical protein
MITATGSTTTPPLTSGTGDAAAMNTLLRGELSAVETYEQAIGKFEGTDTENVSKELRRICAEHHSAVNILRTRVTALGTAPSEGAGVWGVFATAVTGVAKVMGPHTALAALRRGEEHGIGEYEDALANEDVSVECKYLIRNDLLSRCKLHIDALDQLVQQLNLAGK